MSHHLFSSSTGRSIAILATLIIIWLANSACGSATFPPEPTGPTEKSPGPPKITATPIPAVPRATIDIQMPAEGNWKIIPYKVGPTSIEQTEPGWENITVYFAIENAGNQIDVFNPFGVKGYGSKFTVEPSHPIIANSYIRTKEGYEYPDLTMYNNDPERRYDINTLSMGLYGDMPVITGDESAFLKTVMVDDGMNNTYPPSFNRLPPIPPGFRIFGSTSFRVASNTSEPVWVIPNYGEFPLDKLSQGLDFPYQNRPDYIRDLGEVTELQGGVNFKPVQFARHPYETADVAYLVIEVANPTGKDYLLTGLRPYLINSNGWLIPGAWENDQTIFQCYPLTSLYCNLLVGPGQTQKFITGWFILSQVGDVYLEIVDSKQTPPGAPYQTQGWGVYELKKDAAIAEAPAQATQFAEEQNAKETEIAQSTAVAVAATATAEAQANAPALNIVKEFVQGIHAGSSEVANRYYNPDRSQHKEEIWAGSYDNYLRSEGTRYSPLDVYELKGCLDAMPLDDLVYSVNKSYNQVDYDIYLSSQLIDFTSWGENQTAQQQAAIFYVRDLQTQPFLEAVFVAGCSAPPASPPGWIQSGLNGEPIAMLSGSGNVVYAATKGANHGIYKSTDAGQTWQAVNNGLDNLDISNVVVAPANPSIAYIMSDRLWGTNDGGATWRLAEGFDCYGDGAITFTSDDGQMVRAICANSRYDSTDGGLTWQNHGFYDQPGINRIVAAPSAREILFGYTLSGYNPTDGTYYAGQDILYFVPETETWLPAARVGSGQFTHEVAVSRHDPALLYAATPNGIYKSSDSGGSWSPVNTTLPRQGNELYCTSVVTSPWDPQGVFAACEQQVYQSQDGGTTWTLIESPSGVTLLHVLSDSHRLLAATKISGIYIFDLP